jgi:molybdopterin-guanine dinucleotide biosynthesis protein A
MRFGGIVLCGGASTRMGRPKALLPWRGGRPLVAHLASVLREAAGPVVVVAAAGMELPPMDHVRIVVDREPGLGPLAGLREGLEALAPEADLAFATSVDAPFLTAAFVRAMLAFGGAAAAEAGGFVHPLAAAYPTALAPLAAALLAAGERRPLRLLERAGFRRVRPGELPDRGALWNLNCPEDYLAALRQAEIEGSVKVELFGLARARAGVAEVDVPPGRLCEVLEAAAARIPALRALAGHTVAAIEGRRFARDGEVPVGPGERVVVMDATAGG